MCEGVRHHRFKQIAEVPRVVFAEHGHADDGEEVEEQNEQNAWCEG